MRKGSYGLVVRAQGEVQIGRLGWHRFDGSYLYVGSARGTGGIKRVYRHCRVARGERATRQWHIDYLLGLGEVEVAFLVEGEEFPECWLARHLAQITAPVLPGFGSSDCRCPTHLFQLSQGLAPIFRAMAELNLSWEILSLPGQSFAGCR